MHQGLHPLDGWRVVVTRPEHQAAGLVTQLLALGAQPIACPAIAIAPPPAHGPLDLAIDRLDTYDWLIFTSINGVHALAARVAARHLQFPRPAGLRIGALGPATGAAAAQQGLAPDFVPTEYVAEALVAEIGEVVGRRILLLRADAVREALATGLRERGAFVDEVTAYCTVAGRGGSRVVDRLRAHQVDAVTFTSSSTVRYFLDGLSLAGMERDEARRLLNELKVVCIGPVTASTARVEGVRIDAVPGAYTIDGLLDALVGLAARCPATAGGRR